MNAPASRPAGVGLVLAIVLGLTAAPADGTVQLGPLKLFGDLSAQTLVRHKSIDHFQLVQERNTARVGAEWHWAKDGRFLDRYDVPLIGDSTLYLLYRGVYDSLYDIAPGGNLSDITGSNVPGTAIDDIPRRTRDALKYENTLREAYVDIELADLPLRLRIGRQQIVWGETDFFRLLDRVNALDLTWHLLWEFEIQHGWDQLRIPYWMLRWTYELPDLGPVSDASFEGYWNPGDWIPSKRRFLPYATWSVPYTDPLAAFPGGLEKGVLFRQGDYTRDPADNSQIGLRLAGFARGVQFSLDYFYQRWAGDDGSAAAILRADLDPSRAAAALAAGKLPAAYIAPYTHAFGFSANYSEERFTGAVLKTEMLYELGVPFQDGDAPSPVLPLQLFGTAKRDMWKGFVGFDRPTWIRPLNRLSTFLILGQFFWHHVIDNERYVPGRQVGFVGPYGPPLAPLEPDGKPIDQVQDWDLLFSLSATTFYAAGTIVPQLTYVATPTNSFSMMVFWTVDYYLTNQLILNLAQRYFVNTTKDPVYDPWLLGFSRGRSETQVRLTWQF